MLKRRDFLAGSATLVAASAMPARAADPLNVVATTAMVADMAAQIGGADVSVRALMGPGVDPHAYRQTRTDIVAMTRADLVLSHGLYLEAQMEQFFKTLQRRVPVEAAAEVLSEELLLAHPDYADKFDPHVWMDPTLWAQVIPGVQASLTALRPDAGGKFAANGEAFVQEISGLEDYVRSAVQSVPEASRVLVTAHDAFSYFGAAYGFEVLGIQGISTESEAGLARIRDLVDVLVSRQIGAVFVESSVSDRNMRALIEGAAARGHEVTIGGELFSDAMGAPGSYEGTYIGMIDHNATTIARALGGTVPERGMSGRLSMGA